MSIQHQGGGRPPSILPDRRGRACAELLCRRDQARAMTKKKEKVPLASPRSIEMDILRGFLGR
jgi:hypothetical protein